MTAGRLALVAVVAFVAALAGTYTGRTLSPAQEDAGAKLHAIMHDEANLDAGQERALHVLEQGFEQRRKVLEERLRADNKRLAAAIAAEHGYGRQVAGAVDATHHSMGALQKATLEHIFAMRAILRPEQRGAFDKAVDQTLNASTR